MLPQTSDVKALAGFWVGVTAYLYLHLFIPPATPIYRLGDGLIYLQNAVKMLDGQVMYRDFFQFTPPGTEAVYFLLFRLFGPRVWIPNAMLLVLGIALVALSVAISRHVMSGASALLPGLLFLVFAYRYWLDGTHHWLSALATLAALAVALVRRDLSRVAAAGALCGLAACFTQARGVVAVLGFGFFLWWERRRTREGWVTLVQKEACLLGAFCGVVAAFNAYFIWKAGLRRFLECTVFFGVKYYPANLAGSSWRVYFADLPWPHPWYSQPDVLGAYLFIHALLPLVFLLFLARYLRRAVAAPGERWEQLMLVNVLGLALFIGIAPGPGWLRLCSVALPALVLFVWLLDSPGRFERAVRRSLWAIIVVLAVVQTWSKQHHQRQYLDAPPGRSAFVDSGDYDMQRWVALRTRPGEFIFEADFPRMYFPLGLRNPAAVPFLTNTNYTRPEQIVDVIAALESHHVRFVLWSPWLDLPGSTAPSGDHLEPLRAYLRSRYHIVKHIEGSAEVWERN